jgi:hypothetical protein
MTIEIPLTQGKVALIDDEDFERVNQFKWCALKTRGGKFYAERKENGQHVYLHRFLMDAPADMEVDHIDHNRLNCQKHNMRLATNAGNAKNAVKHRDNTSGFKGVSFNKGCGKYQSQIRADGVRHFLGYYDDPTEAARAYDAAARKLHGDFAVANFPQTETL